MQIKCPSCGSMVRVKRNEQLATCNYCGNSVLVTDYVQEPQVNSSTVAFGHSFKKIALFIVIGSIIFSLIAGVFVYFVTNSSGDIAFDKNSISVANTLPDNVLLEFGEDGTAPGYFSDPQFIALDEDGNIIVAEQETGRIQTFDSNGNFLSQWYIDANEDTFVTGMAFASKGKLYLVFSGELYCFDAVTGQKLDSLAHPEGWGFNDVDVASDGSIVASWYKSHDDIVKFNNSGEIVFIIENAISNQTGSSELSTTINYGNAGDIYAYGSFSKVVLRFDSFGIYKDQFGNDDTFIMPQCFGIDTQGRLWVSDFGELLLFNANRELINRIETGYTFVDFVISTNMQLYAITNEKTVIQIDISYY